MLTWKCASRHNGVQFVISHLASWLRTRRFSEPTLGPSGATNHWKNIVFRGFPTFSRTWIFFLLRLSLSSSLHFSDSSHHCFSSVHIVGSLTSKLPSALKKLFTCMCITCIYIHIYKYIHTYHCKHKPRTSLWIIPNCTGYVYGALPKFKPRRDADTYGTDDDLCTHQSSRSGGGLGQ